MRPSRRPAWLLGLALALSTAIGGAYVARATISSTTTRQLFNGDGSTTTFAIPFSMTNVSSSEVRVVKRASNGTETLQTNPTHYTISGSNVVFGTAPASTEKVLIRRVKANTQTYDFIPGGTIPANTLEGVLDKLAMQVQGTNERIDRAILLPETSTSSLIPMAEPSPNMLLGWNSSGDSVINIAQSDVAAENILGTPNYAAYFDASGYLQSEAALAKSRGGFGSDMSAVTLPTSGTYLNNDNTVTVTNKSIDADTNTLTNIENADIKAAAAIALNKLAATTASRALVSDGSGFVSPSAVTSTELGYVSGVTSNIQTQLDGKLGGGLTGNRALYTDVAGNVGASTITSAEQGHLSGVTSNIQTQIDAKASGTQYPSITGLTGALYSNVGVATVEGALAQSRGGTGFSTYTTGDTLYASGSNTLSKLAVGSNGKVLKVTAGVPAWEDQGAGGLYAEGQNLLTNSSWQSVDTSWTASGGSYSRSTGASTIIPPGVGSASWDSSAAAQTLISASTTITALDGLAGRNMVASCAAKCATSTCTHTITAYDGSNDLATAQTLTTTLTGFNRTSVNFIAPSSGTVALKIASVNANEPVLYLDDCFLGLAENFNISQVSQAQFIGSAYIANTAACTPARNSASLGAFTDDTDCPGPTVEFNPGPGTIATTDADNIKFTVNSLPPGYYRVKIDINAENITSNGTITLAINDGTTTSGAVAGPNLTATGPVEMSVIGYFNYTATGNKTFVLYGAAGAGSVRVNTSNGVGQANFSIERWPTSAETAYRADLMDLRAEANHGSGCAWTTASTSYVDPSDDGSGCTFTQTLNRGLTLSTVGSVSPAITLTPPRAGDYKVCAKVIGYNNTGGEYSHYQLTDGTTATGTFSLRGPSGTTFGSGMVCGTYPVTSTASAKTFKVQIKASAGTNNFDGSAVTPTIEWSVQMVGQAIPAPILVGSVTSTNTGAMRIESVTYTSVSSTAIVSQSGPFSITTDHGAGDTTLGIAAGTFSAAPTCICSGEVANATYSTTQCKIGTDTARSATAVRVATGNTAGSNADMVTHLICMGPR